MVKNFAFRSLELVSQYQKPLSALIAIGFGVGIGLAATYSRASLEGLMSALVMGVVGLGAGALLAFVVPETLNRKTVVEAKPSPGD